MSEAEPPGPDSDESLHGAGDPAGAADEPHDLAAEGPLELSDRATEAPPKDPLARRVHAWWVRASLPIPTLAVFAVFALVLWLNAAINSFRFNVALAVLASIPLGVLVIRGAGLARRTARHEDSTHG